MRVITSFKGHLPTSTTLPFQGPEAIFQLVGRDFGGLRLQDAHRAILSQIASSSAFANQWTAAKVSNVQYASGLTEQQVLLAAADLEQKGLVQGLIYKGEVYIAPTQRGAEALWLTWTNDRLLVDDQDR